MVVIQDYSSLSLQEDLSVTVANSLQILKGNGIINTSFEGYEPYKGDISYRKTGSLIAYEDGEAVTYGLFQRTGPGTLSSDLVKVYAGMIVGENPRTEDIRG